MNFKKTDRDVTSDIKRLIGSELDTPSRLIEQLHAINDHFGCLPKPHMAALSQITARTEVEVIEVASFYHHFHIVDEVPNETQVTIRICNSTSCCMAGADELLTAVHELKIDHPNFVIETAPCIGRCEQAPVAVVQQFPIVAATAQKVWEAMEAEQYKHPSSRRTRESFSAAEVVEQCAGIVPINTVINPSWVGVTNYRINGGYRLLSSVRGGQITTDSLIEELESSALRGLGGAGFPAGRKWRVVNGFGGPRFIAVNLDEGEPGTFKDRTFLERDPHRFLEGLLIASEVIEAEHCYIYIRDEYHGCRQILIDAISELADEGTISEGFLEIRRGAGAYICGEESAMIESIEGKRGEPRHRPPYVAEVGLFGHPTLVHNFETLYWVRDIIERGAQWFGTYGRNGRKGLRSFSVSGRVKLPGVKVAPAGITISELIDEYCGGMADEQIFYGYMPGGASGGILPANLNAIPLDFDTLQPYGCFIGSAAVVVLSQADRARDAALNVMSFFEHESCGQCTPCRLGTQASVRLMQEPAWNNDALGDLKQVMADASICGLGQAAPNVISCVQKYFPDEVVDG